MASSIDPTALYQRAAMLVPALRERAEATERARQVASASIDDLRAAGLFRIVQPARFGGFELDFAVLINLIVEISRGCGSTGWVYGLAATSQWLLAAFPLKAQEEVWSADPDTLVQGSYAPSAAAEPVDGGFRISGTWGFASGCDHAAWFMIGTLLPSPDGGRPAPGFLLLPRRDYRIDDNWHTVGLCGTGSKNVVVDNAFVPAHRAVGVAALSAGTTPGAAVHRNPLYRIPFLSVIPATLAAPAVGIVQDALDGFVATTRARTTRGAIAGGGNRVAEFAIVQSRIGEAAGLIDAARLLLLRDLTEVLANVSDGTAVDVAMRIRNRRDHALVVRFCQQAVDALYACTGASGLFLDNRIQRAWRDVNAIAKHISVNWDAVSAMYGQHALGLEPRGQF